MNELLDHAARVLDHQPTRSMEADDLYRRAVQATGADADYATFLGHLARDRSRFAVIPADPIAGPGAAWEPRRRSLYEAALRAAGLARPVIVLIAPTQREPMTEDRPLTPLDVLRDAHEALTSLLHAAGDDPSLRTAVLLAADELHAVQRAIRS